MLVWERYGVGGLQERCSLGWGAQRCVGGVKKRVMKGQQFIILHVFSLALEFSSSSLKSRSDGGWRQECVGWGVKPTPACPRASGSP